MDYKLIYQRLCKRGQGRIKEAGVFYEKHHIIPRSFGGSNKKENLTLLTLKEHYLAHVLLAYNYPESKKMKYALWMMIHTTPTSKVEYERFKPSIRTYERIRKEYSEFCAKGENNPRYGKPVSEKSRETCRQRSIGNTWTKGRVVSEGTRKLASESHKKTILSEEHKLKALEILAAGREKRCKTITCTKTGRTFRDVTELSEELQIHAGTVSNWFRGRGRVPDNFHYKRVN